MPSARPINYFHSLSSFLARKKQTDICGDAQLKDGCHTERLLTVQKIYRSVTEGV
jgi:hypothetical protein